MARILRAYSGISLGAYKRMSVARKKQLLDALDILEAREFLRNMTLAQVPQLKKDAREKLHKDFYKRAYPELFEKKKSYLTFEQIQGHLAKTNRK